MAGNLSRMASVWRSSTPRNAATTTRPIRRTGSGGYTPGEGSTNRNTASSGRPAQDDEFLNSIVTLPAAARSGAMNDALAEAQAAGWEPLPHIALPRAAMSGQMREEQDAARTNPIPARAPRIVPSIADRSTADTWQQHRRELTEEEWAQLTSDQQTQVLLNTELFKAYDTDAESSAGADNRLALLREMGLQDWTDTDLNRRLGLGSGIMTHYSDLFPADSANRPEREGIAGSSRAAAREELIGSLSDNISSYIASLQNTSAANQYNFADETARTDYEFIFEDMLFPSALQINTWAQTRQGLSSAGYDPEDFKAYVLDRIKLLPMTEGRTSLADIQSWFG